MVESNCNFDLPLISVALPLPPIPSFEIPSFAVNIGIDLNLDLPELFPAIPLPPITEFPKLPDFRINIGIDLNLDLPEIIPSFPLPPLPQLEIPDLSIPCPLDN